ncbi:MAG: LysM peptidoglycan-binding domain-containing protein [Deltaproteobacteria bacterium]|nr:LysM peptidoglycan-binding domain-containing protein [Deltaproteobacteria bacterium]
MTLKPSLYAAAALSIILFGSSPVLAEEEGKDYHIVVKGDTLWDISEKYMKNPFFWPKLWQWNDYITNAHFIYPGDKINLVPPKIRVRSAPVPEEVSQPEEAEPVEEQVEAEEAPLEEAPVIKEPTPKIIIEKQKYNIRHLRSSGMISPEEMKASGKIVDALDKKIMLGDSDIVYMALNREAKRGEILSIFKPTVKITHPVTRKNLGHKIERLGHIKVIDTSQGITTGEIVESFNVVSRDDKIRQKENLPDEITIKEVSLPLEGHIVTSMEAITIYGQNDVVYIDLGKNHGVDEGFIFTIYKPPHRKGKYTLPAETIGRLLVFQVKKMTSTAIIIDAVQEIRTGEHIKAVLQ